VGNIMDELPMVCSVRHSQMHGRTALQFVLRGSQRGITQLWAAMSSIHFYCVGSVCTSSYCVSSQKDPLA
jgi:hypothetical protein